jgi:SAM-dependent methyltransferase
MPRFCRPAWSFDYSVAAWDVGVEVGRVTITLAQPYEDLTFMTPLSEERADQLVGFLTGDLHGTVLDIGCGWAELLLRAVAAAPDARGIGVDTNEASIEHGRQLAAQRGLTDRVTLTCGDGKDQAPERADAVVCIGASQVWGPPVEDNQPLDYSSALAAIRATAPRGARVVYGEGIWSSPPTAEAVAPLAGRLDELVSLAELVDLAVAQSFMPVAVHEASLDEWDQFESGFSACYAKWLAEHGPDHPDAAEVHGRAARQRAGYFGGYRAVMGMAYLALLAV